jgi:hypothetical protein
MGQLLIWVCVGLFIMSVKNHHIVQSCWCLAPLDSYSMWPPHWKVVPLVGFRAPDIHPDPSWASLALVATSQILRAYSLCHSVKPSMTGSTTREPVSWRLERDGLVTFEEAVKKGSCTTMA